MIEIPGNQETEGQEILVQASWNKNIPDRIETCFNVQMYTNVRWLSFGRVVQWINGFDKM